MLFFIVSYNAIIIATEQLVEEMTMKKISAGLILTDKTKFLGCHSTGNYFYDIPKGSIEEGETALEACIREVQEETGLHVEGENLIDLGVFDYNYEKNLHLFLLVKEDLPQTEQMICTTYFETKSGKKLPEADKFRYIKFSEKEVFLTENMKRVIQKIEEQALA